MSGLHALILLLPLGSCSAPAPASAPAGARGALGTPAHAERVMTSRFCADCHPAIYAEHEANTHGMAFLDKETRLATHNFRREDCVRCHTPRPVFETGIGMTPMQRWTDLEEGNTCMSCHWKKGVDYARFTGGKECKTSFDPRVGEVEACASCHRIAGTPDQWSRAEQGRKAGRVCMDCHMPLVERPVAVGEPPREVRSHVFPASHSEKQLRRAYEWKVALEGSEVVVRITNKGAGHNFPTATRQRALESLVTVRDAQGNVLGSSRMSCIYPYASELAPGQLTMPVSSQIPSGKTREQRVPLPVASGTVECSLFFKIYRPSADSDPELARVLETETLPFDGVTPSTGVIVDPPISGPAAPAASVEEFFDPAGFCNVARPEPGGGPVAIPEGRTHEERLRLVSLLEFHMPEARRLAHEKLRALGVEALPELLAGLGAWSNETFNQAQEILIEIGAPALPALEKALKDPELYVRCHARSVIARIGAPAATLRELQGGLALPEPLDRRSAAEALGALHAAEASPKLVQLLGDVDPDVVSAAAQALARLDARAAVPELRGALARAQSLELRRDLATALCELGEPAGVQVLLGALDVHDDALRESCFENLFAVTGLFCGYDPDAPRPVRLEALARLQGFWTEQGGARWLRRRRELDPRVRAHTLELVLALGEGSDTVAPGDNARILKELVGLGEEAVPALLDALTFPAGYWQKRQLACEALGEIGSKDAAPFLAAALRDEAPPVCDAACAALARAGDPAVLPQLGRYEQQLRGWRGDPQRGPHVERLLEGAARTRRALE
jgi:HEAT repeat protein